MYKVKEEDKKVDKNLFYSSLVFVALAVLDIPNKLAR